MVHVERPRPQPDGRGLVHTARRAASPDCGGAGGGRVGLGSRNSLYVASTTVPGTGEITVLEGFNGSRFTSQQVRLDGLTVGTHTIGSIALGPDGQLYIGVGAVSDHNGPPGNVLSFAPMLEPPRGEGDRAGQRLRTRVLRPAPARDRCRARRPWPLPAARGAERVEPGRPGGRLRLPGCYDQGGQACAGTRPPLATFGAHATPTAVAVKGDVALVLENGSSFLQNPTGSDIQRVDLRTGQHTVFWRSPVKHDPVGAVIGPDGNLYITLFASGEIVRFTL